MVVLELTQLATPLITAIAQTVTTHLAVPVVTLALAVVAAIMLFTVVKPVA